MTPPTAVPSAFPSLAPPAPAAPAAASPVLDRLAVRVRDRVAAEQAAANPYGDGAHAASLPFPWPF
ncbi:HaaA family cyclophane-containing RiPP peptide [Streptomyces sp. NPDC050095]|uniref:HaaA family cyclophane-containing RiPP peptide n=1 Tax=unclassified Streptomyces TaxID=2593676 RepID=UPI0034454E98